MTSGLCGATTQQRPFRCSGSQCVDYLRQHAGVLVSGGLIGQEQLGCAHQCPGNGAPLLFSERCFLGRPVGQLDEVEPVEQCHQPFSVERFSHPAP